jgi:hypothetical protein
VVKEVPVELFAKLTTSGHTLVLKRNNVSYQTISQLPNRIEIVYAIRHPYDVLTSNNPNSDRIYHIDVDRWLGEMAALRSVLQAGRRITIVRYEDLVADADKVQRMLADELGLEVKTPAADLPLVFKASKQAEKAMHGVRRIDASSMHKYRSDPKKLAYLKSIRPQLNDSLNWAALTFGYDIKLD